MVVRALCFVVSDGADMKTRKLVPRVCSVCGDRKDVRADILARAVVPLMCAPCTATQRNAKHGISIGRRTR